MIPFFIGMFVGAVVTFAAFALACVDDRRTEQDEMVRRAEKKVEKSNDESRC